MKKKDKVSVKYEELEKLKRKCSCGHSVYILKGSKKICSWCGHYVYASPLEQFKDKLKEMMNKNKREVEYE